MDTTVSARIPVAVKERGGAILKEIGATPTELINAAYQYLLANHELPGAKEAHDLPRNVHRTLSKEQKERVREFLDSVYLGPWPEDKTYDELLAEARDERFASYV